MADRYIRTVLLPWVSLAPDLDGLRRESQGASGPKLGLAACRKMPASSANWQTVEPTDASPWVPRRTSCERAT